MYHGLDASGVAIAKARQRCLGEAPGFEVRFEVADFESFTPKGSYDAIVFNESLAYARDPVTVLDRFQSLLSPGGVFVVSLCYNWWQERVMERITTAYPTLHSAEVINEESLTWQVRMLAGAKRTAVPPHSTVVTHQRGGRGFRGWQRAA